MMRLIATPALVAMLMTTACMHTPEETDPVETAQPVEETREPAEVQETTPPTTRERAQRAIQLLGEGKEAPAMVELEAILAEKTKDRTALKLRDQILKDPGELLGESHKTYTVKEGETTSSLAHRFLGDPLLFYAFSRYNNLEAPNRLMMGQVLKLPDRSVEQQEAQVKTVEGPKPPVDTEVVSSEDAAAANALRLEALEELNAGEAETAMALLRSALALNSNNPNIAADLAKVERIQAALTKSR